jgi:hypothetical protein
MIIVIVVVLITVLVNVSILSFIFPSEVQMEIVVLFNFS